MVRKITFRKAVNAMAVQGNSLVTDIDNAVEKNTSFRQILWEGEKMTVTVMSIPIGGEIGAEIHTDMDQFIKIESGTGRVVFKNEEGQVYYERAFDDDYAIIIAANTWHNIYNTGNEALKLFSVYAPPVNNI